MVLMALITTLQHFSTISKLPCSANDTKSTDSESLAARYLIVSFSDTDIDLDSIAFQARIRCEYGIRIIFMSLPCTYRSMLKETSKEGLGKRPCKRLAKAIGQRLEKYL